MRAKNRGLGSGVGLPDGVRRVLVLGASRSGIAAALALARLGVEVFLSDRKDRQALPGLEETSDAGVRFIGEEQLIALWPAPDLIAKSPGVPADAGPVVFARDQQVPVWSEVELAYALLPNPISAITGTNGKTTTAALLGHILTTAGKRARVLGNIGVAVTSVVGDTTPEEELVLEVSSFQLEDIHMFRPDVGVFLNLTPDHLDRHGSLERYLACKARLFSNQNSEDTAILNLADASVVCVGADLIARADGPVVMFFSVIGPEPVVAIDGAGTVSCLCRPAAWVADGHIFFQGEPVLHVSEIRLPGLHNLENCLAAGIAAIARGAGIGAVAEGLRTFPGVAHRLERAGIVSGVTYVNDSKATNVEAVLTALNAYPERTHLILGGRDKGSDYRPIARACARGCRAVYLIGEAAPLIETAFAEVRSGEGLRAIPVPKAYEDLEQAVRAAAAAAQVGDVVLLAPACSSFDQYEDFEERGEHFRVIVASLVTA